MQREDPAAPQRGSRILVVDDNEDSADSLSELLAACGHDLRKAYTGRGALDIALREPPDVAILDIGLPDLNGLEVARRLRAHEATAGTLLIALSGWGQAADRQRSVDAGFDHHLIKPADPDRILDIIQLARGTTSRGPEDDLAP